MKIQFNGIEISLLPFIFNLFAFLWFNLPFFHYLDSRDPIDLFVVNNSYCLNETEVYVFLHEV